MLDVRDLETHFFTNRGVLRAVGGVSFQVGAREAVGLVGESGSGKSMTALSIMRLIPEPGRIVKGQVFFKGRDLLRLDDEEMRRVRGKEISIVFQDPMTYLNPVFRVGDQISEAILLHQRVSKGEAKEKTKEFLDMAGIADPDRIAGCYPHQLSGGMRQRVLIAMALSSNPSLLIADEPTSALDATVQAQILDQLQRLRKELNLTLMLITHDMGIIAEVCDRAMVMYAGKIVENANVFQLFDNPKHPYTSGLLSCMLSLKSKQQFITIPGIVPDLHETMPGCRFYPRCPSRKDVCQIKEPLVKEVEPGHFVSCLLYD
jgi:oligopeptide/dipeptide ABC transporter ATP-binding protein